MRGRIVQRFFPTILALLSVVATTQASAATIVTFVALESGDALSVTNPQPTTVTGRIRLIPDAGFATAAALAFSLGGLETKSFSSVLASFGVPTLPAILAIESTDVVKVSGASLRLGFSERRLTLPLRFKPTTPTIGSLSLGILNGLVRVNIYEHQDSGTPLASRTFASSREEVTRLRYSDVILGGLPISDGYAEVVPVTGQVVATVVNPPMKRRAAAPPRTPPPVLSIAGSSACEFAGGIRATVSPAVGATYRWSVVNATAQGSTAGNAVDLVLGTRGYASIALERTIGGSLSTAEAVIAIKGKPEVRDLGATDAIVGQPAIVRWDATGDSARLYGTDFPGDGQTVDLATGEYRYTTSAVGTKDVQLVAENACGNTSSNTTYHVTPTCTKPSASITVPSSVEPSATFTASMPSGATNYSWDVSGGTITSGRGTATVSITAGSAGAVSIHSTASNGVGCTDTSVANVSIVIPTPIITDFTVPSIVEWATTAHVSFTLQHTDSWIITTASTSKGWDGAFDPGDANYFGDLSQGPQGATTWTGASSCSPHSNCTPKTSGSITLYFAPSLPNNDALILTATGPGGTTTASVPVKTPGGNCKAVQIADQVPIGTSVTLTVKWITSDAGTLVPSSSLGNAITPTSRPVPEGLASYSFTYTRSIAGDDHVRFTGPGCEVQATIK